MAILKVKGLIYFAQQVSQALSSQRSFFYHKEKADFEYDLAKANLLSSQVRELL